MGLFSRLFSKSPADLLSKGDRYMASDSFFEARTCFEDGLGLCSGEGAGVELAAVFTERIGVANKKLAERNIVEAERSYSSGNIDKAVEHLELVKTLTYDIALREKADSLLLSYSHHEDPVQQINSSSCTSCSCSSEAESNDSMIPDALLPLLEYYELLIQQLPADQYHRYCELGENFACAYISASRDEHQNALSALEGCRDLVPQDIYCYEKGKVLHRLGNDNEAEQLFLSAIQLNRENSLAWFALALLLRENNRFQDALTTIDTMVTERIMPEQALLLRADIFEITGNHDSAVDLYVELLQTPYARAAAERLHGILIEMGRQDDAAAIFKKYLKSCH